MSQITEYKSFQIAKVPVTAILIMVVLVLLFDKSSQAQVTDSTSILTDTANILSDSVAIATDSVKQKGPIDTTIEYTAKDSINYDMLTGKVFLYGEAKVTYGNMIIEAAEIQFDMRQSTVYANGVPDSSGRLTGIPVFTQAGQTYNAEKMTYNMKTEKGIISGIVTQQGDGYIKSGKVKRTPENAMYAAGNIYTTCNLEEPHFGIRAQQLKIVPNKYVIAGPFNFELNGVPTPLGFAFGLFPFSDKRSAGIVVPTYGETRERGFYLRDGGFYVPVGEYAGVKFLGQIYSLGGWGASIDANYKVRYKFSGGLNFSYNKVKRQLDNLEETESTDYWLRWRHSPVSRGTGRFSANVNVGSSSFNRNNSFNTQDYISASFNSSVSYNKTFEGTPFTAGASLRINQNVNTEITNLFPEANLSMRRVFPFKGNSPKKNPLTQLSFSYSVNTRAEITNEEDKIRYPFTRVFPNITATDVDTGTTTDEEDETPPDFFGNFGTFLADAQYGAVHRVPISTNLTLLKFFQISPGFNYNEYWYPQKASYVYSEKDQGVIVTEDPGFARAYDYSGSVSMNTRLYAFYYPKIGKIEGIRHMMTPSISYSYRPDFSDPRFGFFQNVQRDETGENFQKVSRFQGGLYGGPGQGRSSSMSFSLNNQIEAKVRGKEDSTGVAKAKKVPVIQNLSISSSYNFAADSFNLSNISFSARTQLFKNLPVVNGMSVNVNATIDPYTYILEDVSEGSDGKLDITQRRTPNYAWETGNGIGQLTNAGIALSTSLSPPKKEKKDKPDATEREKEQLEYIRNNPDLYIDFNVPWTLRVNYNLRYSKQGFRDASVVQTLNFSGDMKLTENWRIGFRSSYDFEEKGFGFTSLNISRDLHCWQMQMSWIPFGPRQSYNIDISVKSAILSDLKLSKRNTWFDR